MCEESIHLCIDDIESVQQRAVRVYLASPLTSQTVHCRLQNSRARRVITEKLMRCRNAFFQVYDPAENTQPGTSHSADEVYRIDFRETITSDLIILHVNSPSTGLGIEAQLASDAAVPRVIVFPKACCLSRMLLGIPSQDLALMEYEDVADLRLQFREQLPEIARAVVTRFPARRRFMESVRNAQLGKFLVRMRIKRGITRSQLATKALLPDDYIRNLERFDECAIALTAIQAHQIGEALECRYRPLGNAAPSFEENNGCPALGEVERESLETLASFVVRQNIRNEHRVFELWNDYVEMRSHAIAGRESLGESQTESDWEEAFGSDDGLF